MHEAPASMAIEQMVSSWLTLVGLGIEVLAAVVIVAGLGWSTGLFLWRRMAEHHYEAYKIRVGRSLLLGLEVLLAGIDRPDHRGRTEVFTDPLHRPVHERVDVTSLGEEPKAESGAFPVDPQLYPRAVRGKGSR